MQILLGEVITFEKLQLSPVATGDTNSINSLF